MPFVSFGWITETLILSEDATEAVIPSGAEIWLTCFGN